MLLALPSRPMARAVVLTVAPGITVMVTPVLPGVDDTVVVDGFGAEGSQTTD
jgi:hypothetical protein